MPNLRSAVPLGVLMSAVAMIIIHLIMREALVAQKQFEQGYSPQESEKGYHQSLPGRLAEAVFIATELKRSNSYLQLICPSEQGIGGRPADHNPPVIGTTCEAWANREWMEMLWHVADRTMKAVEWSSGSGTLWTLRRGLTLHTIEHW